MYYRSNMHGSDARDPAQAIGSHDSVETGKTRFKVKFPICAI